jgi:aryl-alcohol dehydrogenase-like predicted oxidoreductase
METRQFGKTDMRITPIGFGAWAIGGGNWEFAWGPQDDEQSVAAIRRALDLGVNWIDTAAVYGLGHSEEIVARALKGVAQRPYVFTKGSMVWNEQGQIGHSLKAASLRREVEASLRRLQADAIDLYQIHWPDPESDIEEGWSTLAELKQEGKLRHIGVSNFNVEQLRRAMAIAPVETLQPPYSLIDRDAEAEILPFARERNIGVIVYSPMNSGLLSGAMTRERIANLPEDDWR